jgi:mono/diheme cytochrome c family protein
VRLRDSTWLVAGVLLAGAACGDAGFERPDRGDQVSSADSLYLPALFDSIAWADDLTRARSGNEVYASRCRDCHGTLGEGNTAYARERGLDVPSLVAADWPLGDSLDAVRRRIFVGHEDGMPTWGVARISPRDVDAAAFYIVERLRPEMLGN